MEYFTIPVDEWAPLERSNRSELSDTLVDLRSNEAILVRSVYVFVNVPMNLTVYYICSVLT